MPRKIPYQLPPKKDQIKQDPDDFSDLSVRQRKLVDEYLILNNKERAAINAGYPAKSAYARGYAEFRNIRVLAYYKYRIAQIQEKSEQNVNKILRQLHDIAECDMRDYIDGDGQLKDLSNVDGRLIQSIRPTRYGVGLTLASKEKALELLGRYYSMWDDKLDITTKGEQVNTVNITFQEVTKDSMKEAKSNGKTKTDSGGKTTD